MSPDDGRRLLRSFGLAYQTVVERQLQALPVDTLHRSGMSIYYKDSAGLVGEVFNLGELHKRQLSLQHVFDQDGILPFERENSETIFITRTPEPSWMRIWIPLSNQDVYDVRDSLRFYKGLEQIKFDEVATMPVQVGGVKARELMKKAIYFELDIFESGIGYRFPSVHPVVAKFASRNYGHVPTQLELPQK